MLKLKSKSFVAFLAVLTAVLSLSIYTSYAMMNNEQKAVVITFDDGPDPRFTPTILDTLSQYNVKATFFITGDNARLQPDLVKRIVEEGHIVANHTTTHRHLEEMSYDEVKNELMEWDNTIYSILGYIPENSHYFRPPRGKLSDNITLISKELQKEIVMWDVCVENKTTKTPIEVNKRVMNIIKEKNGGILLAHDGNLDRTLTVQSFPLIMDSLANEGYQFRQLDQYLNEQNQNIATILFKK